LHGLQHSQQLTLLVLLAVLDGDLDDGALHRGGDRVTADSALPAAGTAFTGLGLRGGITATTSESEIPGQGHFKPPAADLDDDLLPFWCVRRVRGGLGERL